MGSVEPLLKPSEPFVVSPSNHIERYLKPSEPFVVSPSNHIERYLKPSEPFVVSPSNHIERYLKPSEPFAVSPSNHIGRYLKSSEPFAVSPSNHIERYLKSSEPFVVSPSNHIGRQLETCPLAWLRKQVRRTDLQHTTLDTTGKVPRIAFGELVCYYGCMNIANRCPRAQDPSVTGASVVGALGNALWPHLAANGRLWIAQSRSSGLS